LPWLVFPDSSQRSWDLYSAVTLQKKTNQKKCPTTNST